MTAQSFVPGSPGATGVGPYPPSVSPAVPGQYPGPNTMEPPIVNFNTGPGYPPSQPPPYNPMVPPRGRHRPPPPPMPYPGMHRMRRPGFASYPRHRRPIHIYRRSRPRYCRPVVHIIRSDSCSSISTCSTISSCSRRCSPCPAPQQQQIILLPIQCQQSSRPAITAPIQTQTQPIIIPPIQRSFVSPPVANLTSTPLIIQPINTISQGKPQQFQAGPIQYVQTPPKVQFQLATPTSTTIPQHIIVNSAMRTN